MNPNQAVHNLQWSELSTQFFLKYVCAKTRVQTVQNNEAKYLESNIQRGYLRFIIEKCSILQQITAGRSLKKILPLQFKRASG